MFSKKSSSTQEKGHGFHQAPKSEKKGKKTVIKVNYDVGFPNVLYMRGNGGNLNWERGVPLTNVKADEWVWETDLDFTEGEFKVLINDIQFESGENHPLKSGANISYSPQF
jgi:hypothetical protein